MSDFYRYHLFFCTHERKNKAHCQEHDASSLRNYAKQRVKDLKLKKVRINNSGCLNRCALGPMLVIYPEGVWYQYHNIKDIDEIIQYYIDNQIDSLVTVRKEQFQAFCDGKSINFDIDEQLPRTQDISPILICAWPVCIWKRETFMKSFEDKGHAVFSGNLGFYPVSFLKSIKIYYFNATILFSDCEYN